MPSAVLPENSAVVFDIDGTLAISSSAHLDALAAVAKEVLDVACHFEVGNEVPLMNGINVAGWVDFQCFQALVHHSRFRWTLELYEQLLEAYREQYHRLANEGAYLGSPIPGATSVLADLLDAGVHLALSTGNASFIAETKLNTLGLGQYFEFHSSLGFGDVHEDRIKVAASAVQALPAHVQRVYLVGDTAADMKAARRSGAQAVGVTTGAASASELHRAGAYVILNSVRDLPKQLGVHSSLSSEKDADSWRGLT